MNIWTITVTLLLHITPCYLQQQSTWWSGQASPPASQNSRAATSGSQPGGQVVRDPSWNQAPKSWPNTEPSGWSASQKRHVTVKPRLMNGPPSSRHRPHPPGKVQPGKNGIRNYNWKPGVYPYPHVKKPASPQRRGKPSSPTWRAPGMPSVAPPKRRWGDTRGQNRSPGHKVNKAPKPHELVKGWTSTGTQSLWTDQGSNKNAQATTLQSQRSARQHIPAWLKKRPATAATKRRESTGKVYHSNGPRGPPYPHPRSRYTPKPYPRTGYTAKPYPRTGYTPEPYSRTGYTPTPPFRASGNPHASHQPRKPTNYQKKERHRSSNRPGDIPSRNPQYRPEAHINKITSAPPHRRHEERKGFSAPPRSIQRFDGPKPLPRNPVTDNRQPTRPRTRTSRTEPSPSKPAHGGSRGESFNRAEQRRVDDVNQNDRHRSETAPNREPRRRQVASRNEPKQSNTVQSIEPRRRKPASRIESTLSDTFTGMEPSQSNIVSHKKETVHNHPSRPSPNAVDVHPREDPIPSAQPNRISNTPKTDSVHHTSIPDTHSHKDSPHSDVFTDPNTRGGNAITHTKTEHIDKLTHTEPTHSSITTQTESIQDFSPLTRKTTKYTEESSRGNLPTKPTVMTESATPQTRHINDLTDKSNMPVPQESVQLAVEVTPIHPTNAVEQHYERDPITEKIIAELKRKLKIMSTQNNRHSATDQPEGNVTASVLEVMQKQQLPSADPPQETMTSKTQEKSNSHLNDLHHPPASQHEQERKPNTERRPRPGGNRKHSGSVPNPDITEIAQTERTSSTRRKSSSSSSHNGHPLDLTHSTDMHHEEIAEPRRAKSRRIPDTLETPYHERSSIRHGQANAHPNDRQGRSHTSKHTMDHHANVELTHHRDQLPEQRVKSHRRKADINDIGYYEGVTDVRLKATVHPDDARHAPRAERRVDRHHSPNKRIPHRVLPDEATIEPTIEFIGRQYTDSHKSTSTGRKRRLPDPRPAPIPPRHDTKLRRPAETGDLLSVYNSKTDTYIEPPPDFTPRPKSEADIWGKSQPTAPSPPAPRAHELPPDHWGPNSNAPNPHMAPPSSYMPASDPYATPPDPHAPPQPVYPQSRDDGWPGRQPGYQPGTGEAFTNQQVSVNTDVHMSAQPGYAPDPYHGHPQEPYPYEYPGGPQAPYPQTGPPETYQPAGPPEPYHPAGPQESYPAVSQPGAYYQDPHQPRPYVPSPVDPYGPPPTAPPQPIYRTPATVRTTTDDDPVIDPAIGNAWYQPTPHPPAAPYHTTPSPLTNFDPYPGPPYAQPPPGARHPPLYDAPLFNQYTIRYPDGSASKEEYTEVTNAVQRIVNYVYDSTLRVYKIADYFVMDRNTDSFAIRIAKDMCYVGTLDSAILDSFTEYTMKTRNATEAVIYSNERLFFFKEIEQVFLNDVNSTRGSYIAGSCGDAFMFRVRMVKPRMIHMNDGSILPGSTCPYGAPLKEPRGQVTSCTSGYCQSRDHTCSPTDHICCPKMPASTRCMHLSIGKFCVSYSANNVIIN